MPSHPIPCHPTPHHPIPQHTIPHQIISYHIYIQNPVFTAKDFGALRDIYIYTYMHTYRSRECGEEGVPTMNSKLPLKSPACHKTDTPTLAVYLRTKHTHTTILNLSTRPTTMTPNHLVAEFISPKKLTLLVLEWVIIPKSVKCIH